MLQEMDGTPQMECFGERWVIHALAAISDAKIPTPETEMRQVSFAVEGNVDVCLVEHCDEMETMTPNAVEVASVHGLKSMEVESEETPEEMTEPSIQTLGLPVPPQ